MKYSSHVMLCSNALLGNGCVLGGLVCMLELASKWEFKACAHPFDRLGLLCDRVATSCHYVLHLLFWGQSVNKTAIVICLGVPSPDGLNINWYTFWDGALLW